jgi:hypothetical protein
MKVSGRITEVRKWAVSSGEAGRGGGEGRGCIKEEADVRVLA